MKGLAFVGIVHALQSLQSLPVTPPPAPVYIVLRADCARRSPDERILQVELARGREELERGLSKRPTPLALDRGMLFVLDHPRPAAFWMKDTWIPLDILYFDAQGRFINRHAMPVEANPGVPTRTYPSLGNAAYALETAPGAVKTPPQKSLLLCVESVRY